MAKTTYLGFGLALLAEKLEELERITASRETVQKLMIGADIYRLRKAKEQHRQYRERKAHRGELVQLDGSTSDWFNTGTKSWLLNFVDDATSEAFMVYAPAESTTKMMKKKIKNPR